MTTPPKKKILQKDYIHSAVRLPPELHQQLKLAAEFNGRSLNAEILSRLSRNPETEVMQELADLKAMLRLLVNSR